VSASRAASSASGVSGIVSRLEMLGLRERVEVGVEGIEDDEKDPGYCKFTGNGSLNFVADRSGEECVELGVLFEPNGTVDIW